MWRSTSLVSTGRLLDGALVNTRHRSTRVRKKTRQFLLQRTHKRLQGGEGLLPHGPSPARHPGAGVHQRPQPTDRGQRRRFEGRQLGRQRWLTKALRVGLGGVDDAEDAAIILHKVRPRHPGRSGPGPGTESRRGGDGRGSATTTPAAASRRSRARPSSQRSARGTRRPTATRPHLSSGGPTARRSLRGHGLRGPRRRRDLVSLPVRAEDGDRQPRDRAPTGPRRPRPPAHADGVLPRCRPRPHHSRPQPGGGKDQATIRLIFRRRGIL